MQKPQLKRLIEAGHYQPEPAQVAQAMLRRRGVRELLISGVAHGSNGSSANGAGANGSSANGGLPLSAADRIQSPSAVPRQAA
jgi:hypothetical protein